MKLLRLLLVAVSDPDIYVWYGVIALPWHEYVSFHFVLCCNFVSVLEGTNFYGGGKRCLVSVVGIRAGRDLFRTFDCGGRDLGLRP